ncbi:type II secretion system protein F (GspF) [Oryzisolibacter propanilivorax]|uniref:Type II secretion system protein F (GspF) n=1 Tax=Oryzisolibacter propanilivorax TaxID=1527607 RepID=A0A1G9S5M8_9BURK|nr:type II secretion system F family protein [Oryzisolibacter propanilivorax]SDM30600.1 type II secretion system protein F (GspF) [Oryzisolibacter propanilivorax]
MRPRPRLDTNALPGAPAASARVPSATTEAPAGAAAWGLAGTGRRRRVAIKHVLATTEQLLTLLDAGLPLDRALHITQGTIEQPHLRAVMQEVVLDVEKGNTLADAFQRHPGVFPRLYVNMVRAGEEGGVLPVVMHRLVEFYTRSIEFRSFLVTSSIYPLVLFVFGICALLGLTVFVLPKFGQIFQDMNQALPLPAAVLIGIGNFLKSYGLVLLALLAAAGFGVGYALRDEAWRERWQRALLRLPLIGSLMLKVQLAHVCRTWGTLLASGVPILTGMRIVRELTDHLPLRRSLDRLVRAVQEGQGVAAPVRADPLFPKLLGQLATVGEEAGSLDTMLIRVADQYEKDIQKATRSLVALFEPVMILVMGGLIGGIVISMLTAIFSINDMPL